LLVPPSSSKHFHFTGLEMIRYYINPENNKNEQKYLAFTLADDHPEYTLLYILGYTGLDGELDNNLFLIYAAV
jgi:hypothetical protein